MDVPHTQGRGAPSTPKNQTSPQWEPQGNRFYSCSWKCLITAGPMWQGESGCVSPSVHFFFMLYRMCAGNLWLRVSAAV